MSALIYAIYASILDILVKLAGTNTKLAGTNTKLHTDFCAMKLVVCNNCLFIYLFLCIYIRVFALAPGSSVSIATSYGLEGPGNESRWDEIFHNCPDRLLGPTQPPVKWVPCLSQGQTAAGA